jgi:hypothetical protein
MCLFFYVTASLCFFSDVVIINRRPSLAKRKSVHMDVDATQGIHTLHTATTFNQHTALYLVLRLVIQYSAALSA